MHTTQLRPAPSFLHQFGAWVASPNLLRAAALSVLMAAAMTVTFELGHASPREAVADTPPVVTRYVDVVSADAVWSADESASGTTPDRAH